MRAGHGVNVENASVLKILRGATACFGRRGYHGTSLMDIAREAGVSKSLLHYHFDSKEHLFLEAQLLLLRGLIEHVRTITDGGRSGSIRTLEAALDEVMDFVERDLEHIAVMLEFRNVAQVNPAVAEQLEHFQDELLHIATDGIEEALGPMVDQLRVPPDRLGRVLLTLFNGLVVDLAFARGDDARQRVRATFDDLRTLLVSAAIVPLT